MLRSYVVDTHALFWHLTASPRLSERARQVFEDAYQGNAILIVSPIVLLELYGVVRKVGAPIDFSNEVDLFARPPFQAEPITLDDLRLLDQLPSIPELHDKLIGATALRLGAPVITRDPEIQSCPVLETIW